jgi:GT2 family glycosyltransferase
MLPSPSPNVTVSIVSHRHGAHVEALIGDLARLCADSVEVVLTINAPEPLALETEGLPMRVVLTRNEAPRGFGANHNAASRLARTEYFCVMNPDIRLETNPFPALLEALRAPDVAVAAPLVRNSRGEVEDSARTFPTLTILFRKLLGRPLPLDYSLQAPLVFPDWVAGMFMAFRRDLYASLGGFDEGYFLYYEDVDLCARVRAKGMRVALVTAASVVHDAQRASRRNLRHTLWHAQSALRYFRKARRLNVATSRA